MGFNKYLLFVVLSVALFALSGCGEDKTIHTGGTTTTTIGGGTTTTTTGTASEGETLYKQNCSTGCHGVPTTLAMSSRTVDKIKAKNMQTTAWSKVALTDAQLQQIVTYLLTQP